MNGMLPTTALLRCWNTFEATAELQRFNCCFASALTWKSDGRGAGEAAPWQRSQQHTRWGTVPHPISAMTQTSQCHAKCWETHSTASRLLPLSSHRQFPEPENDTNNSLASEQDPEESAGAQESLSWAGGSRQVPCFSSPYLAQPSPQTVFQLLTITTFKVRA